MAANDNDSDVCAKLELLLAEQKLMAEQLGKIKDLLRARKQQTLKRVKSVRERSATELVAQYRPTELDRARARKILARHKRPT